MVKSNNAKNWHVSGSIGAGEENETLFDLKATQHKSFNIMNKCETQKLQIMKITICQKGIANG